MDACVVAYKVSTCTWSATGGYLITHRRLSRRLRRTRLCGSALEELQVLSLNLECQTIQVNGLSAGLIHTVCLLFDFFILNNHELLDSKHLFAERLDCHQLIVWFGLLNLKEDLEDLVVLVLHLNQAQLLLLVFTHIWVQLPALLDFVE